MINEQVKEKNLNNWFDLIGKETKLECDKLLTTVQKLRDSGKTIYPSQDNILNALKFVNPNDVKVVILGQDPYHEPEQAMGLSFSVPEGVSIPPSLRNIFKELNSDIGCPIPESGDLTKWAEQGVLLLNTVLTVEAHKANSHKSLGWQKITTKIIEVTARLNQPVVYLCWGSQADKILKCVADITWGWKNNHCILRSTHPSPLSANKSTKKYSAFIGSKPFSNTNKLIEQSHCKPIEWNLGDNYVRNR